MASHLERRKCVLNIFHQQIRNEHPTRNGTTCTLSNHEAKASRGDARLGRFPCGLETALQRDYGAFLHRAAGRFSKKKKPAGNDLLEPAQIRR